MTVADPRRFLYRSLDPEGAKRLAAKHLSAHDDGELWNTYLSTTSLSMASWGSTGSRRAL